LVLDELENGPLDLLFEKEEKGIEERVYCDPPTVARREKHSMVRVRSSDVKRMMILPKWMIVHLQVNELEEMRVEKKKRCSGEEELFGVPGGG